MPHLKDCLCFIYKKKVMDLDSECIVLEYRCYVIVVLMGIALMIVFGYVNRIVSGRIMESMNCVFLS